MSEPRSFQVFGEPVEIHVNSEVTGGAFSVIVQTLKPGGGPPPHLHTHEDEIFTALDGEFEMFDGSSWSPLRKGESLFCPRGGVHAFRNSGTIPGRMQVIISPAGFENCLEELSRYNPAEQMDAIVETGARYGVHFVR